jgi:signal peptidase I
MDFLTSPRVARRLVDLLLVLVVGTVALVAAVSLLGPAFGLRPLVIRGASMEPTIHRGSLVLATEGVADRIAVGDVVSFHEPNGTVVTHRVVAITESAVEGTLLTTRGDANPGADPAALPADRVIGRVVFAAPFLGFVSAMLGMPSGILSLVLLAFGLFVLSALIAEVAGGPCPACDAEMAERAADSAGSRSAA